ncbi:MAG: ABC transporter ATP-binding protein [Bdellovibrionales bacterium]|nr:ABC transporter ATP-binding protein [Bdellovibrionales bacterium]
MLDPSTVLKLESVSLAFGVDFYRRRSFRDWAANPFATQPKGARQLIVSDSISLEIKRGQRLGILGRNGAGKTSLCRLIAGIYTPDSGRILRQGTIRAVLDTAIGTFPELTGRENAELLSHFIFSDRPDRAELVREAIEWSELGPQIDTAFQTYSRGMQTRLVLSLISALPYDLLILDEVFDGADRFFSEKTLPRVMRMIENSGAVVFVSHSESQIRKVCNRVLVLEQGKVLFDGEPDAGLDFYMKRG